MNPEMMLTREELQALIERGEGQFLELKSLWDLSGNRRRAISRQSARNFVAECVAAFANADGGTLVLGVEDDGTVTGHGFPEDAVAALLSVPERRLQSCVRCRTQRVALEGGEVLVFEVPIMPEAVMVGGNGFPYRVGDTVVREPQEVINARKTAYRRVGYEQQVRQDATLEDVDLDLAQRFLASTVFASRDVEAVLQRYGLLIPRSGTLAVTNACLLLFARYPAARWHPRAGMRFFRVAGTERRHGSERNVTQLERVEPPLALAIPEAHRLARGHIRRSERLHDLFFREMPEYPEFAWQEAIVNAVAHRDYQDGGREIEVWFFEDRMEVRSPGDLVPPVTLDLLRQRRPVHASRNPLLVRVMADAGLMREEGEGIPRMFEEMEEVFLQPPSLDMEAAQFVVTLCNEPIFAGPSREWQTLVDQLSLKTSQRRVLLAQPEGFTNEDYRRFNSVDRDQAYREIQEMIALGIVAPAEAPGRGAVYRVAENLREARAFLQSRLPALRTFFRKHNSLKNADYREMFVLTRHAAVRELRRLVDEGLLVLQGERRGARYLPGPQLTGSGADRRVR